MIFYILIYLSGSCRSPLIQDSNAIFGITNIFEYLLEKSPEDAAARERQQLVNIATAAGKISSLEHLILHTLPAGKKLSDTFVPHFDVSRFRT